GGRWHDAAKSEGRGIAAEQCRQPGPYERYLRAFCFEAERVVVGCAGAGSAQRMALRKAHGTLRRARARRGADQLRELHGLLHALGCTEAADRDPWILRVEQALRNVLRLRRVDARDPRRRVRRDLHVARFLFLMLDV